MNELILTGDNLDIESLYAFSQNALNPNAKITITIAPEAIARQHRLRPFRQSAD
jgi:hypothetical protein